MKKLSQINWVAEQLELGRNLTDNMARDEYDITRLAAIVCELKKHGMKIQAKAGLIDKHPLRETYWLEKKDVKQIDMFERNTKVEQILGNNL